ncbi:MAG: hypothetical protein ACREHG_08315 [Candidatus Saccharimonadales bacterium]
MFPQLTEQDVYNLSTTQLQQLGQVFYVPGLNGLKGYRYIQFGGTSAISAGKLLVAAAAPSNSTGLALPTTNTSVNLSSGSRQVLVTNGSTTVAANQFAGGQLEVLGANGYSNYTIAGNSADSVGNAQLTVQLAEALRNTSALVAGTNTVNLRQSPSYNPAASTTQALPVGVTIMPVANSSTVTYFGFVQISGPGFVYATTATKGYTVVQDTAGTAGYVANNAADTTPQIGIAMESAASSLAPVFLQIN